MRTEPIRVLHVIMRLDRGGSAENTLLTVAGMDPNFYASTVAVGPTQGPRSPTEERARARGVDFVDFHYHSEADPIDDKLTVVLARQKTRQGVLRPCDRGVPTRYGAVTSICYSSSLLWRPVPPAQW